jgi:type IV pilus assembly protein PilO
MQIGRHDIRGDNIGSWPLGVRAAAIAIVILTLLMFGYWFDSSGQTEQLQKLQRKEAPLKQQLAQKQQLAVNLKIYQKQLKQAQTNFKELVALLPADQQLPKLIEDISKLGQGAGLRLSLLQPRPAKTHQFYIESPLHIIVTGRYSQLIQFINNLSSMERIVTFGNFSLTPATESKVSIPDPLLRFEFTANTHRYDAKAGQINKAKGG